MARNMVVAGDYKGDLVGVTFKDKAFLWVKSPGHKFKKDRLFMDNETVKKVELQHGDNDRGAIRNTARGMVFGMAGINARKTDYLVKIEWTDGKKSLLEIDGERYNALQIGCFK